MLTTTLGKTSGIVKIAGFDLDNEDREIRKKNRHYISKT
ncbi:hypothetical protein [Methanobrevibacter arboriphilus]